MGVLACDRRGCERIMCERHSNEYGYLCWECFDELVNLGVKTDINQFMDTPKAVSVNTEGSRAYFEHEFRTTIWEED